MKKKRSVHLNVNINRTFNILLSLLILLLISLLVISTVISINQGFNFNNFNDGLDNLKELKVTTEHPFLINREWVSASKLKICDKIQTLEGKTAVIKDIKLVKTSEPFSVYNLEVPGYNNFIVTSDNLIVHNSNLVSETRPRSFGDCINGKCKVKVKYPGDPSMGGKAGKVEEMTLSKFYAKYQNNPRLRLLNTDGKPIKISDIIETTQLDETKSIVKFSYINNHGSKLL